METIISTVKEKHPYLFKQDYLVPTNNMWLKSPTGPKVIWCNKYVNELDPNTTTVIGGICATKATSLKEMDRLSINTIEDFEKWHLSWYPRIDQLHDSIGIPPKSCKNVVYVFEDLTHADRIVNIRKHFDVHSVRQILKDAHLKQGQKSIENWLKNFGYNGKVSVVFLSDIEKEIDLGIRIASKLGFKKADKNKQIRKLMYTSLWSTVLGIGGNALIYEPIHYIQRHFTVYNNMLDNIGIMSYIPYISGNFTLDEIPHKDIPNFGNHLFVPTEKTFNTLNFNSLSKDEDILKSIKRCFNF